MIPERLLLTVAVAEAVLIGLTALVVFGSAVRLTLRDRRRRARKALVIRSLARALEGEDFARVGKNALRSEPRWLQAEVITELLPTLSGLRRRRLMRLALDSGLATKAQRLCASRRWTRRLRGAHLLTLLGSSETTVAAMLDDDHPEVRAQAAEGAGAHPPAARVKTLLDLLSDPEPLVRFAAKDALLCIGRPAAAPLADLLVRDRGEGLLDALDVAAGLAGPEFLEPALMLRASDRAAVRGRAGRLLGAIGGPEATEALMRLLEDPDPRPRAAAAESLARLGQWPASAALAGLLQDSDWSVRRAAARALRDLGAPGLLFLRRSLGSEDRYARDIAQQALELPETVDHSLAL